MLDKTPPCDENGEQMRDGVTYCCLVLVCYQVRVVGLTERRQSHLMVHRSMELRVLEQHRTSVRYGEHAWNCLCTFYLIAIQNDGGAGYLIWKRNQRFFLCYVCYAHFAKWLRVVLWSLCTMKLRVNHSYSRTNEQIHHIYRHVILPSFFSEKDLRELPRSRDKLRFVYKCFEYIV